MSVSLDVHPLTTMHFSSLVPLTIERLPQELLDKIFSYLSKRDMQVVAQLNRSLGGRVKVAANFNEPVSIKIFIGALTQKLNGEIFSEQRESLIKFSSQIVTQHFANLILLKSYILNKKGQLINILKTVDQETVNDLKASVRFPHFLEDTFELVAFEKQIDEINLIPNESVRGDVLRDLSKSLIQGGNIDRAIAVATLIPNESVKGDVLKYIFKVLTQVRNIDRAIAVATLIPNESVRGDVLGDFSKSLIQGGNVDRAIAAATLIPNESVRGDVLKYIFKVLTQVGNIDRAIQIAMSIPNESVRGKVLEDYPIDS